MKNFRVLLLALGTIFVSTQQSQAGVKELNGKLTILKNNLSTLQGTLLGITGGWKEVAEQALNAAQAAEANFNSFMNAISTSDSNAELAARKKLLEAQKEYATAMEKYIKFAPQEALNNANDAIKWAVVAEAALMEVPFIVTRFSNAVVIAKEANGNTYSKLVYDQFTEALKKLTTTEVKILKGELEKSVGDRVEHIQNPGIAAGFTSVNNYGTPLKAGGLPLYVEAKNAKDAAIKAQTKFLDLIKTLIKNLK
jgi:hypothetical protein